MSIIKKSSFPLHLDVFKVFINDTLPSSRYFKITQLPDTFTGGKNAFSIQGSTELKEGSYLFVEVKDSNGNVIYSEPAGGRPSDYYEGVAKPVAVHVYDDTLFGPATITIVGELKEYDDNGIIRPVPDEWLGKINVKWQRTINVNPFLANTSPIRLYRRPKIEITEKLLGIYERINTQKQYSGYFRGVAIEPPDTTDYPYNGPIKYEIVSINPTSASFTANNNIVLNNAPAVPFRKGSIDRPLNANKIYLQTSTTQGVYSSPSSSWTVGSSWTPTIKSLINPYRAIIDVPYVTDRNGNNPSEIRNIAFGEWISTYESSSVSANPTLSSSYAQIDIKDLETFSGDIYRLKVFAKSRNDLKGFSLLDDIVLEENELLQTNFFEGEINKKIGDFTSQNLIEGTSRFWDIQNTNIGQGNVSISITDNLLDAVLLTGSIENNSEEIFAFRTRTDYEFQSGVEYILSFDSVFSQSPFSDLGNLDVYLSGSAFDDTDSINKRGFGKKVSSLSGNVFKRFGLQSINFKADKTGKGFLVFWIKNGNWELADISLKAASQTAFNPSELSILVKPNVQIPSESFDFRFELFDINYNYVPITLEKTIRFGGGNDIVPGISFTFNDDVPQFFASPNPIFIISPTAVSASTAFFGITASVNIIDPPLIFDSASATAYDTSGSVIQPTDVIGSVYPGLLTNIISNNQNSLAVKATLTYENFNVKIKNTPQGKPRFVGKVEYKVFPENDPAFPPATFTIDSDWSAFLGCVPAVITGINSVRLSDTSATLTLGGYWNYYITASGIRPVLDDQDKGILWVRVSGSNNWYWGGPWFSGQNNPTPYTYISGSVIGGSTPGETGDKPWVLLTGSSIPSGVSIPNGPISNQIAGYVTVAGANKYEYIDFRISKKCYNNIVLDDANDFFRVKSAPFLDIFYRNQLAACDVDFGETPQILNIDGYSLGSGPGAIETFRIECGNFTNTPSSTIRIGLTEGALSDFEIAASGSNPIWLGTSPQQNYIQIPFTNYGNTISFSKFLVRLKAGAPNAGLKTDRLYAFVDGGGGLTTQIVDLDSTVEEGAEFRVGFTFGRNTGASYRLVVNGVVVGTYFDNGTVYPQYVRTINIGDSITVSWFKQLPSAPIGTDAWYQVYKWNLCSVNPAGINEGSDTNGYNASDTTCAVSFDNRFENYIITPTTVGQIITLNLTMDYPYDGTCYADPYSFGAPLPKRIVEFGANGTTLFTPLGGVGGFLCL